MNRVRLLGLCVVAVSLTVGCGGDDGGPALDQCANTADMSEVANIEMMDGGVFTDGGTGVPLTVNAITTACVLTPTCIMLITGGMADQLPACIDDCLDMSAAMNLSQGCQDCYIEAVMCANANCLAPCVADSTSTACLDCVDTNCGPRQTECTGL